MIPSQESSQSASLVTRIDKPSAGRNDKVMTAVGAHRTRRPASIVNRSDKSFDGGAREMVAAVSARRARGWPPLSIGVTTLSGADEAEQLHG